MEDKQRRYEAKLREKGIRRSVPFQMKCHVDHDADIIEYMRQQPNISGLLKSLVRKHMNEAWEGFFFICLHYHYI